MGRIKKFVPTCICNALYFAGHAWSRAILRFDCMAWTYPVYNNLMTWSVAVNDKYGLDCWGKVNDE